MKEQLIFIAAIVLIGWIIAKCSDALLRFDVAEMIDNDYEKQWEKDVMIKEEEKANEKALQRKYLIWLSNQKS
jgi:hypothetical protein